MAKRSAPPTTKPILVDSGPIRVVQIDDTSWSVRNISSDRNQTWFILRINDALWYIRGNHKGNAARIDRIVGGFTCSRCKSHAKFKCDWSGDIVRCYHVGLLAMIGIKADEILVADSSAVSQPTTGQLNAVDDRVGSKRAGDAGSEVRE